MRYFTYRRAAEAVRRAFQTLRFTKGKGSWLNGKWPVSSEITMYDSVDVKQIPSNAQAAAGYVGGKWPTYPRLKAPRTLSIAVNASEDAECLDVEKGDAEIFDAPRWVNRQLARGVKRPVLYCSVSLAPDLLDYLAKHGISRSQIRLWTAHYTFKPHRCSVACWKGFSGQADATQYSDHALGRNLDVSLCSPTFFPPAV